MEPVTPVATAKGFILGSKLYDFLKKLVQVGLPAFATLYYSLSSAWNLPAVDQVMVTTASVATFLGVVLGISKASYDVSDAKFDGAMNVGFTPEGKKIYQLELPSADLERLGEKRTLLFKVVHVVASE